MQPALNTPAFWLRLLIGTGLAVLGAAMLFFSMPPYGIWPLAFLGFVPMLLAQHRIMPARLSSLASAITIGGFWGILIPNIFGPFAAKVWFLQNLWLIVGVIVFLMSLGDRRFHTRSGYRLFVLQGALIWVGIEMIRNLIPFLGTAGFIAYAYYRSPWLIQPVSLTGIFGLSLLNLLLGYSLGLAALALFDRWTSGRGQSLDADLSPAPAGLAWKWLGGVGIAAAAWVALSLAIYFWPAGTANTLRAAAIQPGMQDLGLYESLTRQAAAQGARLVVWPEGALHFDPQREHTGELKALAKETGAYLVMGVGVQTGQGLRNEATILSPEGEFLGVYGKDHPMTYLGETSLTRGGYPVYQTALGALGTIICYDLNFNDTARNMVRSGARLLAVPSNDWPALFDQQYAYLTFRAVENRVPAIKADTAFDSVVIDARGNLTGGHFSSKPTQFILIKDITLGSAGTPHLVLGDWIGWLSLAGMLILIVYPLIKKG